MAAHNDSQGTATSTTRFSDRAEDYAKYRPSYPDQLIAATLADLGPTIRLRIADIGAGTGISSDLYSKKGASVVAVEPNSEMLGIGQLQFPEIEFVKGTAEDSGLPASSFDLVVCFQSFHWFRPVSSLGEIHRILRPGRRVALAWNVRDNADRFTSDYSSIVDAHGDPNLIKDLNSKHETGEHLLNSAVFVNGRKMSFAYSQKMGLSGLLGRMRSVSYLPKSGAVYNELESEMSTLHRLHADKHGTVTMGYTSILYMAETR
jgi:SAM-dependent methyltransferase